MVQCVHRSCVQWTCIWSVTFVVLFTGKFIVVTLYMNLERLFMSTATYIVSLLNTDFLYKVIQYRVNTLQIQYTLYLYNNFIHPLIERDIIFTTVELLVHVFFFFICIYRLNFLNLSIYVHQMEKQCYLLYIYNAFYMKQYAAESWLLFIVKSIKIFANLPFSVLLMHFKERLYGAFTNKSPY